MQYLATRRPLTTGDLTNGRGLSRLFDEVFQGWAFDQSGALTSGWSPAGDVFENESAVKIVLEVPGVKAEDVKLTLENNRLTVRGEKKQVAEEKTERVHRYGRSYGSFQQTFALPNSIDAEKIEATYEQGVLTITLPKAERAKPREIEVKASR
jgi:HSP20 family protein